MMIELMVKREKEWNGKRSKEWEYESVAYQAYELGFSGWRNKEVEEEEEEEERG